MAEESGIIPASLQNKPVLGEEWDFPLSVWRTLTGSRQLSQGVIGEIPYTAVATWAMLHGFIGDDLDDLWREVHLIDTVWTENARAKQQEQAKEATEARTKAPAAVPNREQRTSSHAARP